MYERRLSVKEIAVSQFLVIIAYLLLGGAFVVFGIRNTKSVPGLAKVLESRKISQPVNAARLGVAMQLVGGALVFIAPFVPLAGVLGGLLLIAFLVLATALFHPVWAYQGEARTPHISPTIMNTGLVGAFLLVIAYGL